MFRLVITAALAALGFFFALASPARAAWVWPLAGDVITPYSNGSDPYAGGQHRGIDIAGDAGAPVVAASAGTVRFAGTAGSSGLTVSIRTVDGFDTSYLHLSAAAVREGTVVAAGERIGAVGTTGTRSADQPHLHFGVRDAGSRHGYRDPLGLLPPAPPVGGNPQDAPAAQPAPVPLPPATAPEPLARGERSPVRGADPAGRRLVEGGRAAAGAGNPSSAAAPRPVPRPAPAPRASKSPRADRVHQPVAGAAPVPSPRPAHGPARASKGKSAPITRTGLGSDVGAPEAAPGEPSGPVSAGPGPGRADLGPRPGGPDWGLVVACLGLLGAAALLGLSEDGRAATRRTGQRAAGLLRPLVGRR